MKLVDGGGGAWHAGSRGAGLAPARGLDAAMPGPAAQDGLSHGGGPSPGDPVWQTAMDDSRAGRIGTIVRFAARLRGRGVLQEDDEPDEFFVAHRIQKYAYIASALGVRLDYRFVFLEVGAFSGDLALDLHSYRHARGGHDPFGESPDALDALEHIVRGRRDIRWLQMATFAIRDLGSGETRDEFASRMADGRMGYTKRAAADAFDRVHSRLGGQGPGR